MHYTGYRIGTLEKELLKKILNVKNNELPNQYSDTFSDIFKTVRQKSEYSNVIKRLEKKGLLRFINRNGILRNTLTKKGIVTARFITSNYYKREKPKNWDGKWHLVIFDIPEKKKKIRNLLRFHLKRIGFIKVQASVWVYPYSCEEVISIIKTYFNLNNEVLYFTTEYIENDKKLRRIFKIS